MPKPILSTLFPFLFLKQKKDEDDKSPKAIEEMFHILNYGFGASLSYSKQRNLKDVDGFYICCIISFFISKTSIFSNYMTVVSVSSYHHPRMSLGKKNSISVDAESDSGNMSNQL